MILTHLFPLQVPDCMHCFTVEQKGMVLTEGQMLQQTSDYRRIAAKTAGAWL